MRALVFSLAVSAVAATASPARAEDPHAPPVLTPPLARQLVVACPGTARYADALARGSGEADAAAAASQFENCAGAARRARTEARRQIASTAAGAAYLTLGLLRHDAAMLQRAVDATAELRALLPLSDDQVRRWTAIPDAVDLKRRKLLIATECAIGDPTLAAAYVNVAARDGSAWIAVARPSPEGCPALPATAYDGPEKPVPMTLLPRGTIPGRPTPAIMPDEAPKTPH
jgi:hypothetical protein